MVVLRNRLADQQRHAARLPLALLPDAAPFHETLPQRDLDTPLTPGDLAEVGEGDVLSRIEVLCLSGLWTRLPGDVWEG